MSFSRGYKLTVCTPNHHQQIFNHNQSVVFTSPYGTVFSSLVFTSPSCLHQSTVYQSIVFTSTQFHQSMVSSLQPSPVYSLNWSIASATSKSSSIYSLHQSTVFTSLKSSLVYNLHQLQSSPVNKSTVLTSLQLSQVFNLHQLQSSTVNKFTVFTSQQTVPPVNKSSPVS